MDTADQLADLARRAAAYRGLPYVVHLNPKLVEMMTDEDLQHLREYLAGDRSDPPFAD